MARLRLDHDPPQTPPLQRLVLAEGSPEMRADKDFAMAEAILANTPADASWHQCIQKLQDLPLDVKVGRWGDAHTSPHR